MPLNIGYVKDKVSLLFGCAHFGLMFASED